MTDSFFSYKFDKRLIGMWWPLGVREGKHGVTVTEDELTATYGRKQLNTPIANVAGGHITEKYRWYTAVGIRMSFVDDGLTFGTNIERGVCIHFRERVGGVVGKRKHSALTVTVDDCDGLISAIGGADPR